MGASEDDRVVLLSGATWSTDKESSELAWCCRALATIALLASE